MNPGDDAASATSDQPGSPTRVHWKVRLGVPLAILLYRILGATWRLKRVNAAAFDSVRAAGEPVIFSLWHGQMLPLIWCHRNERVTILVSEHRDGEVITRISAALGYDAVRGSTSRNSVRALLALVRVLKSGRDVAFTPDGPRGPARVFAPGALLAAQRSGAPLIPIAAHASRAWRLRSWDSFLIPKPFARVVVAYGPPTRIAPGESADTQLAERMQRLLNDAAELASVSV